MLGTRSRMEQLADEIWPGVRPFGMGLYKSYQDILFSNTSKFTSNPRVQLFRQIVQNSPITEEELLDTVGDVYRIFNKKAAHPAGFNAPVPDANDTAGIETMLQNYGLIPDSSKVETIRIFLTKFPSPPKPSTVSTHKPLFNPSVSTLSSSMST
jgi:hypothetical protein